MVILQYLNFLAVCPKDWVQNKRSCYKFIKRPKLQYAAAQRACKESFSTLVHINTASEDRFLKKYLKNKYKNFSTWRTGARRVNYTFVWDNGEGRKSVPMNYNAWEGSVPKGFSTMVLERKKSSKDFTWQGSWTGSMSQLPNHTFSYICERKARSKCNRRHVKQYTVFTDLTFSVSRNFKIS
jgi:hypothetical protein